jgi:hypothetical protein
LICLWEEFYNDPTQETQWWGAPNHMEPQPHLLSNFPTIAWNNLHLSSCCLQINYKIKKLVMSLCRPRRDEVPMIY